MPVRYRTDPTASSPTCATETLARPWAIPGTPGLEHRIGGLSKQEERTGNVSYDPENHARMIGCARRRWRGSRTELPPVEVITGDDRGDLLVVGWGGTYGAIASAVAAARADGLARVGDPPAPPEPVPAQPRRRARRRSSRCSCRSSTRASSRCSCARASWCRALALEDPGTTVQGARRSALASTSSLRGDRGLTRWQRRLPVLTAKDFKSDQDVRWCPGCGDYSILANVQRVMPELGRAARELRVRVGDRLLEPLPLLHEHLRHAHDPRPRAARSPPGIKASAAGALGVGRDGRRRRALDRRQPPAAHDPPQRRPPDPAVQQPRLRPHQGPVLADVARRA